MGKQRFTFEVDSNEVFDTVAKVGDGGSALGQRIVGVFLLGRADFLEAVGMAVYGVTLLSEDDSQHAGAASEGAPSAPSLNKINGVPPPLKGGRETGGEV